VVQPAERNCVLVGRWLVLNRKQLLKYLVLPVTLLALAACSQPQSQATFVAQPGVLPNTGGRVQLNWDVQGTSYYTISSEPKLPGLPFTTTRTQTTLQLQRNTTTDPKSYIFILEANTPGGLQRMTISVRLEGQLICAAKESVLTPVKAKLSATGMGRFDVPHVAGRLLAYNTSGGLQSDSNLTAQSLGAQLLQELGNGWNLYRTPVGQEEAIANGLFKQGLSQYVQPEYLYQPDGLTVPPDNRDYALDQATLFRQMNLEQAWRQFQDGCYQPVVAVADTGVYTGRADLAPNLTPKESWLDVVGSDLTTPLAQQGRVEPNPGSGASHGTQVSGIIAATTNSGSALAGAAYNLAKVLPIKVFDAQRRAGTLQVAQALEYAAGSTTIGGQRFVNPTPAQVANLSLSISGADFSDPYLESVLQRVTQQGLIVVASSGNTDTSSVSYPASSSYVIAVGATDAEAKRARWLGGFASNYGSDLEFVAPGTGVPVLYGAAKDDYAMAYGTSAAAPFISATIALYILQKQRYAKAGNPSDFLGQVRQCLQSASQNGPSDWNPQTGYGLVDAARVVDPGNSVCFGGN